MRTDSRARTLQITKPMRSILRSIFLGCFAVGGFCASLTLVAAQPAPPPAAQPPLPALSTLALDGMPPPCRDLGKLSESPSRAQAQSARISLASCIVDHELRTIPICDCEQSVREIDGASTRSLQLLDEVALTGDPAMKILARQAQGDLLSSFATRVLASVPPPADGSEAAIALRETRLMLLRPLVEPWTQRARAAYLEIDQIARAHPQLANNRAVVAAVRASRAKLAQRPAATATR